MTGKLRMLAPLRYRDFRLLAAGQVTSNLGDACYAVALPWYVLSTHGGAVLLGTVLAAYGIPRTGFLAAGGYATDYLGPQAVMMMTDIARAVALSALAASAALGQARALTLVPVAVVLGSGEGFFLPGSFAIIPSLLPGKALRAANALSSSGTQLATLAGTAVGGAIVTFLGPSPAFALDAVSFAVSAATLAFLRVAGPLRPRPAVPRASTAPALLQAGELPEDANEPSPALWPVIRSQRVLQIILLVVTAANLGSGGMDEVALPVLADGPLRSGAAGYGAILAAFGAGALVGAMVAGQFGQLPRPAVTCSFAFLAQAACVAVVPYLGTTAEVAVTMAGLGAMNGFGNVVLITSFQQWAPPSLLGRLFGLLTLGGSGVFPVSVVIAAYFVRSLGTASFFLFAAATLAAAILLGLSQKPWRDFGREPR